MMLVEYTLNLKTLETHFIMVAMKMKFSQKNPFLKFVFCFKARIKKNIRNVHKMFYTYHGCHDNIFSRQIFVKNKKNSNKALF